MDPLTDNETFEIQDLTEDEKRTRYAEISGLKGNRGWLALVEALKDKEARVFKQASFSILSNNMTELEATYIRGLVHGLRWAHKAPENAQQAWERLNQKREDK